MNLDETFSSKTLIKWVGGKQRILDKIINHFPSEINNYHELFLGGGSVLLGLLDCVKDNKIKINGKIYAYDLNSTLIHFYKNIQHNYLDVYKHIKPIIDTYKAITTLKSEIFKKKNGKEYFSQEHPNLNISSKKNKLLLEEFLKKTLSEQLYNNRNQSREAFYYYIRNKYNNMSPQDQMSNYGTALFIFLNKTCFRGVYRMGPDGFNVPYGNYENPEIINIDSLKKISDLIKDVTFIQNDYEESFKNIKANDFVYLDPPYVPEKIDSFVGYTLEGFNLEKHKILFKLTKDLVETNTKFVMSNSNVELVTNSFEDFNIEEIICRRSINSKKPESKTTEVIIYN